MNKSSEKIKDMKIQIPDGNIHFQSLGNGPPVILLHSNASSVRSWANVIEPLARNHSVYALDTMGQGDSGKPPEDYSIEDYSASIISFMELKGIKKTTFIGNSVGAVLAVQVASVKPEKIDRLILVGCPCRETQKEREEARLLQRARYDNKGFRLNRSIDDLKQHYAYVSPVLLREVNEDQLKAGIWALRCSIAMNNFDIVAALKNIRAKSLLVFGEYDSLRSKEMTLRKYIKDSNLAIIRNAGHLPQVDNPTDFLTVVQSFLR